MVEKTCRLYQAVVLLVYKDIQKISSSILHSIEINADYIKKSSVWYKKTILSSILHNIYDEHAPGATWLTKFPKIVCTLGPLEG